MNLIIGATGMLGTEICRLLVADGKPVRAMVRKPFDLGKMKKLKALRVQIVQGDLRNTKTFGPALQGVNTIVSTASSMPNSYEAGTNDIYHVDLEGMIDLIDHTKAARVQHFIYISFSDNMNIDCPLQNAKRTVERYLIESGLTYTILRPGFFMETWLTPALGFDIENSKVSLYGDGTNPVSYISYYDVAKFVMACMSNSFARDNILELGGPELISPLDVVNIFEETSGRHFSVQYTPKEAIKDQIKKTKDPMEISFLALQLAMANGDPIDMRETLTHFPMKLKSIRDFTRSKAIV